MADDDRPDLRIVRPRSGRQPEPKQPRVTGWAKKREALLEMLGRGVPRRHAAAAAGLNHNTLYRQIKRDPAFAAAVELAEGNAVSAAIQTIRGAADSGQWAAAAWFLERRYPEEFGRRYVTPVPDDGEQTIEVVVARSGEVVAGA